MKTNTWTKIGAAAVTVLLLGCLARRAEAHAVVVDMDTTTPGIQTAFTATVGTVVPVDIYIVSDGATPVNAYGFDVEFNDFPGIVTLASATVFDPSGVGLGAAPTPVDYTSGAPIVPGVALTPAGIPPFGIGPGGPFAGNDTGAGMYDISGAGLFFGLAMPAAGTPVLAETVSFTAATVGTTDIAPLGIITPGMGAGPFPPPPPVPGGFEFYDGFVTVASFPAAAAGTGFPAGINPGTLTVIPIPEPVVSMLLVLGLAAVGCGRFRG